MVTRTREPRSVDRRAEQRASRRPDVRSILTAFRPKQWSKNLIVFVGAVFSLRLTDPDAMLMALGAFVTFCLLSSAGYLLNDLIDVDAERLAAYRQRVPAAILWGLLVTSWFTLGLGGYVTGLGGTRQRWLNLSVTILFALFIGLIADLDRPRGGYIQTPYQPLEDLQEAMRPGGDAPGSTTPAARP